ncbi:MAG: hypothetical protein K8F36_05000 [Melioribacteraceae bacterium]|jgi:hypothetical protein|nr:hypothetical protein [Melioribacteraceae bacterium]MDD3558010.1 hypothetical protein [Melioribacteraceae bacterium]
MNKKRPVQALVLFVLVLFQGISGIFGGIGLTIDPTGESLKIPIDWLEGSPFGNYTIPGIVLLFLLGIVPVIIAIGLWKKIAWSRKMSVYLGIALLVWIVVEIAVIGYQHDPPLQLIYGIVGVLILMFSLSSTIKEYYKPGTVHQL